MKLASPRKTNTARRHLHEVSRVIRVMKTETVIVVARGYGREDGAAGFDGSYSL